jgi:CysZ protein
MTSVAARPPLPRSLFGQLGRGASYPLEALGFIGRQRLWLLALTAVAVNIATLAALIAVSLTFIVPVVQVWVAQLHAWSGASQILGALASVVGWLVWILAVLVLLAANTVALLLVGQVLASPFLDMLSERIETLVLGSPPVPLSARRLVLAVLLSLSDLFWSLVYWLAGSTVLAVLGLFVVLAPVAAVLGFVFSALLLANEFIGLALARELVPFRHRWRLLKGQRLLAVGFGSSCMILFAVPGLNLLLLPLAAAGGTLLYCDLRAAGRIDLEAKR